VGRLSDSSIPPALTGEPQTAHFYGTATCLQCPGYLAQIETLGEYIVDKQDRWPLVAGGLGMCSV
jgi:hypothetical protein